MNFIKIFAAAMTVLLLSSCSEDKSSNPPFGTDFLNDFEKGGIELASDDYIIQYLPHETINIFDEDGKITDTFYADYIYAECYDPNSGKALQSGFGYIFETDETAETYYDYTSKGIYTPSSPNALTVWFNSDSDSHYKHNTINMLDNELFSSENTYISIPYLTPKQADCSVSADNNEIERCKG